MRRLLCVLLLATLAAPSPATAKPAPVQIRDRRGDVAVAALDILDGRVSTVLVDGEPVVRVALRLAEPPPAGVVVEYDLIFLVNCDMYIFHLLWGGTAGATDAYIDERNEQCSLVRDRESQTGVILPDAKHPVDVRIDGSVVVWETPYVAKIRPGATAFNFFSQSSVAWLGGEALTVKVGGVPVVVGFGDAGRRVVQKWVIGSDLPKRR